jgi:hypothetical protein
VARSSNLLPRLNVVLAVAMVRLGSEIAIPTVALPTSKPAMRDN